MAKRTATKTATRKPAARARGVTKTPIGSAKRPKNTLDVLAERRRPQAAKKAPADVGHVRGAKVRTGPFEWTPVRDAQLRAMWTTPSRGQVTVLANSLGAPFHVVKQRAVILGLLPGKGRLAQTVPPASVPIAIGDIVALEHLGKAYEGCVVSGEGPGHNIDFEVDGRTIHTVRSGREIRRVRAGNTCKHGTPTVEGSICNDCAEERDEQIKQTDAERIPASKTDKPTKRDRKTLAVTCPQGDEKLEIVRRGKRGFTIVGGAGPEKIYGAGPNGMPICPKHDVEMIAAEPVEVAEAFRQVQAAVEPPAQSALFDTAKDFNADGAMVALDELRQKIVVLRTVVDAKGREVSKLKKDLETLEESLISGIEEFMKRRSAKARKAAEVQDRAELRENAVCSFERHVGKDCPICHAPSRALAIANLDAVIGAYTDITSEAHRAAAVKANSIEAARLTNAGPSVVAEALEIAGLYGVSAGDVETWTDEDRMAALAWLESDQTEQPPDVLGVPHRAAAPGTDSQNCLDCGAQLLSLQGQADDERVVTFPEGALAGMHCTRDLHAAPPAPEIAETAAAASA